VTVSCHLRGTNITIISDNSTIIFNSTNSSFYVSNITFINNISSFTPPGAIRVTRGPIKHTTNNSNNTNSTSHESTGEIIGLVLGVLCTIFCLIAIFENTRKN